jgi:hypothetical protein
MWESDELKGSHISHMRMRNAYKHLYRTPDRKMPLWRSVCSWTDTHMTHLKCQFRRVLTGFVWLRLQSHDGYVRMQEWPFRYHKKQIFSVMLWWPFLVQEDPCTMNCIQSNGFESCSDIMCVPNHDSMVHPEVAVGGDNLQIWRVAANILKKQLWTSDKGWSSSMGVECVANNNSL